MIMWTQVRDGGAAWASTSSLPWPVQEQVRDDHDKWSCWSSDHDYNHDANHGYNADHDYDTDRNLWRTVFCDSGLQDFANKGIPYVPKLMFCGRATNKGSLHTVLKYICFGMSGLPTKIIQMIILIIRFTIILVAFDLEEFGSQGALVFLHDFLFPKVQRLLPLKRTKRRRINCHYKERKKRTNLCLWGSIVQIDQSSS